MSVIRKITIDGYRISLAGIQKGHDGAEILPQREAGLPGLARRSFPKPNTPGGSFFTGAILSRNAISLAVIVAPVSGFVNPTE